MFSFISDVKLLTAAFSKAKSKLECFLSLIPILVLGVTGTVALWEPNGHLTYIYLSLGFVFNTLTIKTIVCSMADKKFGLFHIELIYIVFLTAIMKIGNFEEKLAGNIWLGSTVLLFIFLSSFSIKLLRELADGLGIKILF